MVVEWISQNFVEEMKAIIKRMISLRKQCIASDFTKEMHWKLGRKGLSVVRN